MRAPRAIARLLRLTQLFRRAARRYDSSFLAVARRAVHLHRDLGFRLDEAVPHGLLDPRLPESELAAYTSRKVLRPLQARLNPTELSSLTEDKALFYRLCEELGIPRPTLYALFYREATGWARDGSVLASREEWYAFLGDALPADFVVKPSRGHFGLGVSILRRRPGGFVDSSGHALSTADLYARMCSHPQFDSWVLQERLRSHPELVRLSGTHAVQTARIITFIDRSGDWRIAWAHLRVIVGDSVVDNFHEGKTGNVAAAVSLADDALSTAVRASATELGRTVLAAHPGSGVRFAEVGLPFWAEAR